MQIWSRTQHRTCRDITNDRASYATSLSFHFYFYIIFLVLTLSQISAGKRNFLLHYTGRNDLLKLLCKGNAWQDHNCCRLTCNLLLLAIMLSCRRLHALSSSKKPRCHILKEKTIDNNSKHKERKKETTELKADYSCVLYLPSTPFGSVIGNAFSRRQTIWGCGDPFAVQRRVTFEPSRTTMSVLVG